MNSKPDCAGIHVRFDGCLLNDDLKRGFYIYKNGFWNICLTLLFYLTTA